MILPLKLTDQLIFPAYSTYTCNEVRDYLGDISRKPETQE
jgi:hypothetical protein